MHGDWKCSMDLSQSLLGMKYHPNLPIRKHPSTPPIPTTSNRIIPNGSLPNRLIPHNLSLRSRLNHLEHRHIMVLQIRRRRGPRPIPSAVQLCPRKYSWTKTRDIREAHRQRLGSVCSHQTHDDAVRERTGQELVQLSGYRTRLAGGGKCCGGPARRVLVDGEDALFMLVPSLRGDGWVEALAPCS